MKNNNSSFRNYFVSKVFLIFLLFLGINVQAQFSANWPFTSGLGATVTGATSANITASAATYTAVTGGLFTGAVTTNTGALVGTGISGRALSSCTAFYNAVGVAPAAVITPFLEYKLAPNSGFSMTTNSFTFTVAQSTAISGVTVVAGYSFDNGTSFTGLLPAGGSSVATGPNGSTAITAGSTLTFTVPATSVTATSAFLLRVVVWRNNASSSSSTNIVISSPTIAGTTPVSATPVIAAPLPSTLTGFTYITGSGPSPSQSFAVAGANLTAGITATASTNYEVSSDNVSFSGSATVPQVSGTASGTLFARLRSGLAAGTYNSENIVLSSPAATSQNVSCSGGVSALYYYNGTGALADVSSWGLNTIGTGANPVDFITAYQTFIIRNTTAVSTTAAWTVSGTASKIILGDASLPAVALTTEAVFGITGTLDIAAASSGSNTLRVKNGALPTFGSLNATSTIDIQSAVVINPGTFPNNVSVSNTGVLTLSNAGSGAINVYFIAGNLLVTGTGGITAGSGSSSATLTLTGSGKNISNTATANNFSKLNFTIDGTYTLSGDVTYALAVSTRAFTINATKSLDLAGFKLDLASGALVVNGTLNTTNPTSRVVTSNLGSALPSGQTWGGTVEYASLTGGQTIVAATSYTNLKLSNTSGTNTVASGDLTISAAGSLTVNSGTNLTIPARLINNAAASAVIIENNANLIQTNESSVNATNITVKRNSNALFRLDYTLWSSPTGNTQSMSNFSPLTSTGRFYDYNPVTNLYNVVANATTFSQGKGFLIRMPNENPSNLGASSPYVLGSAPITYSGSFSGVPNNGNVSIAGTVNQFVAVGNPYPSNISANAFIDANLDGTGGGTLYFWRKTNNVVGTAYATYNKLGVTITANQGSGSIVPNGFIAVGQGFITKVPAIGSINFTNAMRSSNSANFLRNSTVSQPDRIWVNLTEGANPVNQMLVGYMDGATNGVDAALDGKYINDNATALTSDIQGAEYTIQGRPTFNVADVVNLNFKAATAGSFTIAIDHVDGLFTNGQAVYLTDNTTGTITNLQTTAYTFTAPAAVNNARFSLKYQNVLNVNAPVFNENSVKIYTVNGTIMVNAGANSINNIKVYDIQGRLLTEQKEVNATSASIKNLGASQQVLIVKVIGADNSVVIKKVVN